MKNSFFFWTKNTPKNVFEHFESTFRTEHWLMFPSSLKYNSPPEYEPKMSSFPSAHHFQKQKPGEWEAEEGQGRAEARLCCRCCTGPAARAGWRCWPRPAPRPSCGCSCRTIISSRSEPPPRGEMAAAASRSSSPGWPVGWTTFLCPSLSVLPLVMGGKS